MVMVVMLLGRAGTLFVTAAEMKWIGNCCM